MSASSVAWKVPLLVMFAAGSPVPLSDHVKRTAAEVRRAVVDQRVAVVAVFAQGLGAATADGERASDRRRRGARQRATRPVKLIVDRQCIARTTVTRRRKDSGFRL